MTVYGRDGSAGARRFPRARMIGVVVMLLVVASMLFHTLYDPEAAGVASPMTEDGSGLASGASPEGESPVQLSAAESSTVGVPEQASASRTAPQIVLEGIATEDGVTVEDGGNYPTSSFTIDFSLCAEDFPDVAGGVAVILMDGESELEKVDPARFVWERERWRCSLKEGLGEGGHEVHIVIVNEMGQRAETESSCFTVDTLAPVLALTPDAEYTKDDVVLSLGADDAALCSVRVEAVCRYGGVDVVTDHLFDGEEGQGGCLTFSSPGETTVTAEAVDEAGNESRLSTSFTIDRQPPVIDDVMISSFPTRLLERDEDGAVEWFFDSELQFTLRAHDMVDAVSEGCMRGISCDDDLACCLCNAVTDGASGNIVVSMADGAALTGAMRMEVSDRAGNVTSWQMPAHGLHVAGSTETVYPDKLIVDTTAPRIVLEGVDGGGCYTGSRDVTVVLDERNLESLRHEFLRRSAEGEAVLSVTCDGKPYAVLGIRELEVSDDAASGRGCLALDEDGSYRIEVCCEDPAGNGTRVVIGDVVIDTIPPVLEVSFDSDDARNGHYYNRARTATVSCTERWFEPSLIDIETSGTVGVWDGEGERHMLEVVFSQDGASRLRCAGSDIAGNEAVAYDSDTFVIDRTTPSVMVEGVVDHVSYTGSPTPVVTLHDENHDASRDVITLSGSVRGPLSIPVEQPDPLTTSCHVPGFPTARGCDDIYTLYASSTDLAGNEAVQEVVFSLNRFGSTYRVLPESETYLAGFEGTGHRSYGDAVMVEEVNVDELVEHSAFVSRDGSVERLAEGRADSVVPMRTAQESGCAFTEMREGSWHRYLYTIAPGTFLAEGTYRIMLRSMDSAGNVSENTLASNDADIALTIDRTKPVVRIWNAQSGECYTDGSHEVYISAFDNLRLESLDVELDGKVLHPERGHDEMVLDIPAETDGEHDLRVRARDAAGNVSEPVEAIGFTVRPAEGGGGIPKPLIAGGVFVLMAACGILVFLRRRPSG